MRFNKILTPRRLSYAWIAGGVLWFTWALSLILGPGMMDLAGQVIGTDYLQFYAAGTTIMKGESDNLYNFDYQSQLERSIAGPELISFHAFITAPFLAFLFAPLSLLPYLYSFIVWSLLGLFFLWTSFRLVSADKPGKRFLWSLTWFPIFAAISFGQNSLLSLILFAMTFWLLRKEKLLSAGLVSSLLLFKPQMVLGIGILWLLEWRKDWKALIGLAAGGLSLAGICFLFLPEASRAYLSLSREFLPDLIYSEQFPLWHLHSLRGFWTLLLPGHELFAEGLSLVLSLAGIIVYVGFWRSHRNEPILLYAGAICLTIWISPHSMIYDWSILIIPAIVFWQARPHAPSFWIPMFAMIWIATFISGPLTYLQLKILPIAIQISIPVLSLVYYTIWKNLPEKQGDIAEPELL